MIKPTLLEIETYLLEKNYTKTQSNTFAEQFWNFYESKGWVVGRSPMKSWQAAIRTWELKNKNNGSYQQSPNGNKLGTSDARIARAKDW